MASLPHLPTFHSLTSHKLFSPQFSSSSLKLHCHQNISASAVKKSRTSRKVKSNAELCNDIREFLSVAGLPGDHVPSMKELSEHGRRDLANIVRRRGYKVIRDLLATSASTSMSGAQEGVGDIKDNSTGQNVKAIDLADDVSLSTNVAPMDKQISSTETCVTPETSSGSSFQERVPSFTLNGTLHSVQDEKMTEPSDNVSLSSDAATTEHSVSSIEVGRQLNSDEQSFISPEASFYSSLQEKAAKFIQNGQLDRIEDTGFGNISETSSGDASYVESQSASELEYGSSSRKIEDLVVCSSDGAEISSEDAILGNSASRNGRRSTDTFIIQDHDEDLDVEMSNMENQVDISRLKYMLHQKELELMQLKEQIEKEKLALSDMQTKAENEISKAQKLVSEKDAELHAAEENLYGLKEVEIQYSGDGESVEVAGSFNGWHQNIQMDPVQPLSILDSSGPRTSQLWSTTLWLYPGVYEIKFIVDGYWKIDPQMESVISGNIHNNILRVDR